MAPRFTADDSDDELLAAVMAENATLRGEPPPGLGASASAKRRARQRKSKAGAGDGDGEAGMEGAGAMVAEARGAEANASRCSSASARLSGSPARLPAHPTSHPASARPLAVALHAVPPACDAGTARCRLSAGQLRALGGIARYGDAVLVAVGGKGYLCIATPWSRAKGWVEYG
jgi:hypothetical protein